MKDGGVVGIPDELCGQVPKAFVVPKDQTLTENDIKSIVEGIAILHINGVKNSCEYD